MLEKRERVRLINTKILELQTQIQELESEKRALLKEIHNDEAVVLNQLPVRAKRALTRYCGIDSDFKLKCFLDGDSSVISSNVVGFRLEYYKKASTYFARLAVIPNIGEGTAKATVEFLERYGFI